VIHGDFAQYEENDSTDAFSLQNKKMLKVLLQYGPVKAKVGSMVAYQGDAQFSGASGGGVAKFIKKAATGEGVQLMDVGGTGEVFLADLASEIEVLYLQDDMVSVNGANVLAFSASIGWDIERVGGGMAGAMAGGMFNVALRGTGYVAVTSQGQPLVFDVAKGAVFADPQAVVCWTGGVRMDIKTADIGLKTLIGKGSGESFQMAFSGQGHVMIQPSEGIWGGTGGAATKGGGLLG
jgi:uncharacterized protein (AIM24 family)